jgi:hypothetical protein
MAGSISVVREVAGAPALAARKRFRGYKPETERASRKAEVMESEALRQMKDSWKSWRYYPEKTVVRKYSPILQIVDNLQYSARDIEQFSLALEEFQDEEYFPEKAGLMLSALINRGKDSDHVIHIQHLSIPLHYLGYLNEKKLIVNGNVGKICGHQMRGGSIVVYGNAWFSVGDKMNGGSILIEGNASDAVGFGMAGGSIVVKGDSRDQLGLMMGDGSITVKGNARYSVGEEMLGGEIRLEGNFENLGKRYGGKIFHKGKLVLEG